MRHALRSSGRFAAPMQIAMFLATVLPGEALAQEYSYKKPELQIQIPTVTFSGVDLSKDNTKVVIPYIAEYISGLYAYLISIIGILAAVMMIIGGFQYMTSGGDAGRVKAAKERITNAVAGALLALGAYVILNTVSPTITKLKGLEIKLVAPTDTKAAMQLASSDVSDSEDKTPELNTIKWPEGVSCPGSGGWNQVQSFISGTKGKVAYRKGGKGGPPPFGDSDPANAELNSNCPDGKICLDSSGYIRLALVCAGVNVPQGGTTALLTGENTKTTDIFSVEKDGKILVKGQAIQPGDLIGHQATEGKSKIAQTFMYLGNGKVVTISGKDAAGDIGPITFNMDQEFMENNGMHWRRTSVEGAPNEFGAVATPPAN